MTGLLLATGNLHKTGEFVKMLGADFILEDLTSHPEIGQVVEDGATFGENSRLKAVTISRQVAGLVMADDSGLEVDSLGGAPGIFSARYAGAGASDEANRRKLLEELARLGPDAARIARFRCVLALARKGQLLATFEGTVEGAIVRVRRGAGGFGYDALFQPNGFARTIAEMSAEEKNAISHRGRAVGQLRDFLSTARFSK